MHKHNNDNPNTPARKHTAIITSQTYALLKYTKPKPDAVSMCAAQCVQHPHIIPASVVTSSKQSKSFQLATPKYSIQHKNKNHSPKHSGTKAHRHNRKSNVRPTQIHQTKARCSVNACRPMCAAPAHHTRRCCDVIEAVNVVSISNAKVPHSTQKYNN